MSNEPYILYWLPVFYFLMFSTVLERVKPSQADVRPSLTQQQILRQISKESKKKYMLLSMPWNNNDQDSDISA